MAVYGTDNFVSVPCVNAGLKLLNIAGFEFPSSGVLLGWN